MGQQKMTLVKSQAPAEWTLEGRPVSNIVKPGVSTAGRKKTTKNMFVLFFSSVFLHAFGLKTRFSRFDGWLEVFFFFVANPGPFLSATAVDV